MTRFMRMARIAVYGLAAITFLLVVATAVERMVWRGKVLPGVELTGASVGGKPAGQVRRAIQGAGAELEGTRLVARAGDERLELDPDDIDFEVRLAATEEAVVDAGRTGNPLAQMVGTVVRRFRPDEVEWAVDFDEAALGEVLDEWEDEVDVAAVDGTLRFEGATVTPVRPKAGRTLDRPRADRMVESALRSGARRDVRLPVRVKQPEITAAEVQAVAEEAERLLASSVTVRFPGAVRARLTPAQLGSVLRAEADGSDLKLEVDQEKLREALGPDVQAIEQEPKDAEFAVSGSSVSVVPHQTGRTIDLKALGKAILSGDRRLRGRLHEKEPDRTTEELEAMGVEEQVSTFTTPFSCCEPRVTNIQIAAKQLDGTILPAGATLSLNQVLGERTREKGYVEAPMLVPPSDQYPDGHAMAVGGGVSQIATTTFNAAFFAGYPFVTYQAHSEYISRYPMGREATISWTSPDLKFTNDTEHALLIKAYAGSTSVTVSFYSTKIREVEALGPEVVERIPPETEYKHDPALARGERRVEQSGSEGMVVRVTRVITRDGEEVGRKVYTTRYRATKEIVAVHPCDDPDESKRPPKEQCDSTTTTTAPSTTTTKPKRRN